jgi:ATP/ADP translocase
MLYILFCVVYLMLYLLFNSGSAGLIGYGLLLVVNDQQWLLFPLVVWALANDMFSVSEAKRLFPVLGIAAFSGGMVGNATAAAVAQIVGQHFGLLLFNAILILFSGIILYFALRRIRITTRQSREGEKLFDSLREGIGFVREVPIYRYLTFAMILLGIGLNAIEFDFLTNVSETYTDAAQVQTFYGTFKLAVAIGLVILQGFVASWLLNKVGFKYIFVILPIVMLIALMMGMLWPGILGIVLGNYIVRISKLGVDEPSNKAFQNLVPDERRGRVSAFMDGYLYPLGSILGCFIVGATLIANGQGLISENSARVLYLGIAMVGAVTALFLTTRIHLHYDRSMLNWRLKRRKRGSAIENLDF